MRSALLAIILLTTCTTTWADDSARPAPIATSQLPGHIDEPAGSLESIAMPLEEGPECRKYRLSVPENRDAVSSRNIRLYFYRFKARKPSSKSPVFFLPGGPGGFYNDDWVNGLNQKPKGGSNFEAWQYTQDRDVVLVNQRGAFRPDRTFQAMFFLSFGASLSTPYDFESQRPLLQENAKIAIDQWTQMGMDLAGYDIMNMVEDINDVRTQLGYEKITLRGTSFGSQWSIAYMKKYSQHVDRAVLGGTEPLDHGWDSSQGFWKVIKRLEREMEQSENHSSLGFPDVSLTGAIKSIVKRLEKSPIVVEAKSDPSAEPKKIPIGVQDFQRCLRSGIGGHRERRSTIARIPQFVYEVYAEDYDYLASRVLKQRPSSGAIPLQLLLVDNSLGISSERESKLEREPGRRWIGELNALYKATRDVTPTPVIDDAFRKLKTNIPILLVHGDYDLSTPIENAYELMADNPNALLITIRGGTHGAFDQIVAHDEQFMAHVKRFLDADFESGNQTINTLDLPHKLSLAPLKFNGMNGPTLFKSLSQ